MPLSMELVQAIRVRQNNGLPEEILEKARLHIKDTVAISLAAYKRAPIARQAIAALSIGTSGSAKVIGSSLRLPPGHAAFSNTALAHALDFDDINDLSRIHPTPVTLAAAIAAADIGKSPAVDLVTAVALGNEILCRMGRAVEPKGIGADANWFLSQLFGYFGAAITAGLVLGLSDEELVHAIGLAYMQAAGGKEAGVGTGSQARSIYPAFASMGGVQAALLASQGVTAPASSLDGPTGFFPIYFGQNLDVHQREILLDTDSWTFSDTSIKLFPSCRYSHPFIKSALILRDKMDLSEIKKIVIGVNETAAMLCRPLADRCRPRTLQDAKFSIPFMVAFTFVHGRVDLNNLTEKALDDPEVLQLAALIEVEPTQHDAPGLPPGDIRVFSEAQEHQYTHILGPETVVDEVKDKFIQCCKYAGIAAPDILWEKLSRQMDYGLVNACII
ncbi:MmgE/PrpD family protein [Planococcus shenhongbingii]|uniref:MmgE/PrpD family protein n=1 Tax=Planococcus shenhongbingii TaxID=3058398 RepID=UPI002624F1BC|nr:MmgE/PrpD family protein [Planococcus sp. N016]WKA56965.1 MmgE/PrpD family protein [Planococcus sp. N016]